MRKHWLRPLYDVSNIAEELTVLKIVISLTWLAANNGQSPKKSGTRSHVVINSKGQFWLTQS